MSLVASKNISSDLLLKLEQGSNVYVMLNQKSQTYVQMNAQLKNDIIGSLILLFDKKEVKEPKFTEAFMQVKTAHEAESAESLKLFQEYVEEFAQTTPSLESHVYVQNNRIQSGKQIFDWNQDSQMLFRERDDFICYQQMIDHYQKDLHLKDDSLQAFITALLAIIFLMKRQAVNFLKKQIQLSKEETSKDKDLSNSYDASCGLSFIDDSVSENNIQAIEVFEIIISSTNNRELHNRENKTNTSSRQLVDQTEIIISKSQVDRSISSLFMKIKQDGKRQRRILQQKFKQLNQSYQSNGSTDKSEHRSQKNMFSPPGLNINTSLQTNDQFFDTLSPQVQRRQHRRNQKNSYQKEEIEEYYDDQINRNLYANQYQEMQNTMNQNNYQQCSMQQMQQMQQVQQMQSQMWQYAQMQQQLQLQQQMQYCQQNQQQQQQSPQQMCGMNPFQQQYQGNYDLQQNQMNFQQYSITQNPQNIQQINNFYIMMDSNQGQQGGYYNMQQQQQPQQFQGYQNQQVMPVNYVVMPLELYQKMRYIKDEIPPRLQKKFLNRHKNRQRNYKRNKQNQKRRKF